MKYFLLLSSFFFIYNLNAQCLEIESILVDACGSPEPQNEMVRFKVGATALNTANMNVVWPPTSGYSWLGVCQNAGTTADIVSVNATIMGCGFLKEPVGGILPANSKVLLVTSTSWSPFVNSFVNLTDTLIVIFQCAGNSGGGHFANYSSGSGLRPLTISFSIPLGCTDAVSYDKALLVNQAGNIGAQDGATVEFTPAGTANYVNHGCQAPFIPFSVDAGANQTVCAGASQSFTASPSGTYSAIQWSLGNGATGFFTPSNSLTTTYTSGINDAGTVKLYCTLSKSCSTQTTTVKDSVLVTVTPAPTVTVNPSNAVICSGQNLILQATTNTAVTYTWSTGIHTNSLQVNSAGVYTVNVSNQCGSASASATLGIGSTAPTLTIVPSSSSLCTGEVATLSVTGSAGSYLWNNGSTSSTISVSNAGAYSVTVTSGSCPPSTAFITINSTPAPTISILPQTAMLCPGNTIILTATSNTNNFLWNNGVTTNNLSISTAGIYSVTTTQCGVATATAYVTGLSVLPITLTSSSNSICPNQTATLTVTGGDLIPQTGMPVSYNWSNSILTGSVNTTSGGSVTVSTTNACGTYTQSIIVAVYNVHAIISANPVIGIKPLVVDFKNTSVGNTTQNWNFGNGNTSNNSIAPEQTYSAAGDYTASITVGDGVCIDKAYITIKVLNEEPNLIVPNVFTPNNDLVNDVFRLKASNITEFKGIIINRWGLEIFSWNDISEGWDGKINGNVCSDGSYFYIVTARDLNDKEIQLQGSFSLLR